MDENKFFYIIPHDNFFEFVLKANLSEEKVLSDINFIISSCQYFKTISISQLWSTKVNETFCKFEIQIQISESEKDKIISFIESMDYKHIQL